MMKLDVSKRLHELTDGTLVPSCGYGGSVVLRAYEIKCLFFSPQF